MKTLKNSLIASLAIGFVVGGLNLHAADKLHREHDHDAAAAKAEKKISETLAGLSTDDQKAAKAQRFCPMIPHSRLVAMGTPVKVSVAGESVFVCCKGCVKNAVDGGEATIKKAKKLTDASAELAKLPADERAATEAQKFCAIANNSFLGSMGAPIKLELNGEAVYLCCDGCTAKAKANPGATVAKVAELKKAGKNHDHGEHDGHEHDEVK